MEFDQFTFLFCIDLGLCFDVVLRCGSRKMSLQFELEANGPVRSCSAHEDSLAENRDKNAFRVEQAALCFELFSLMSPSVSLNA